MTRSSAAIYCRISEDAEGESLGVARQEQDCRDLAARLTLDVTAVFIDNDLGASTRSRKPRPQYAQMLERAGAGEFDYLLAYSNSRLTRRPLELEALIGLHERTSTRIVTVVSGEDNLSTADGRMVARIKASVDAGEAERTAERVARKHLENALSGVPVGGTRPFGWEDDKKTLRVSEATLIREAAVDMLAGVGVGTVANRWNAAEITTSTGRPWQGRTVRQMMRSPRLSGWRVHRGKVAVGRDGSPVRGLWEPVLDQTTHDAVVARLSVPEGRSRIPKRNARHYLLTGTIRCGVCHSLMYGNRVGDGRYSYYQCGESLRDHTVSASARGVDAFVTAVVLARMATVDLDTPTPTFTGTARLAEVEGQVRGLMTQFTTRALSGEAVFPAVAALEVERDRLRDERKRVDALSAGPDLTRIDAAAWETLDTERRRNVVETLLDAVLIRPAGTRRGNQFDAGRVGIVWRRT